MFIQTLTSYRLVIADLENTDGSELLVAQLRKRVAELKSKYRTEIEFELLELNGSMARHPSQRQRTRTRERGENNGRPKKLHARGSGLAD
jgi:hypothetical protein